MKRNLLILLVLLAIVGNSDAQIPRTISYQGDLRNTQGIPVSDGKHILNFSFYSTGFGGTPFYTESLETQSANGIFSVVIGGLNPLPDSIKFDNGYFLGISIDGSEELTPRTAFTSVPYALHAQIADALSPNAFIPAGLILGSAAPSGPALGDLSGTYPFPKVIGLQGRPISAIQPLAGDFLMWNGSNWYPGVPPPPVALHVGGSGAVYPNNSYNQTVKFTTNTGATYFDDGGFFNMDSSVFSVPETGVYRIDLLLGLGLKTSYSLLPVADIIIELSVGGKTVSPKELTQPYFIGNSSNSVIFQYSTVVKLAAGQNVKFIVQSEDDNLGGINSSDLTIYKLK